MSIEIAHQKNILNGYKVLKYGRSSQHKPLEFKVPQDHQNKHTIQQLFIKGQVEDRILLSIVNSSNFDIAAFDGPGIKSNRMKPIKVRNM